MAVHRRRAAVAAVLVLVLASAGPAVAATPQRIYRDLADNGQLDTKYTRTDIERAFNLPSVVRTDPEGVPRGPIREPAAADAGAATAATTRSDHLLPFSALDAALLLAGGGPLLLIGAGLRRQRQTQNSAQVVRG